MPPHRRRALLFLAALGGALAGASPAQAAVTFVQKSAEASGSGTSVTATLSSGTTAGDLLVATVEDLNSNCTSDSYSGPSGWVKAGSICRAGTNPGPLQIWYDPDVASGITSVTFNSGSSGANSRLQVSEWKGVALSSPLDKTGTASSSSTGTSLTVSTSGSISYSGELAVTGFDTSSGLSSFTPGASWTSLLSDPSNGFDSDYRIGPPSGAAASETITTNPQTNYGGLIATFRPACTGGSLTVEAPGTTSFPNLTLNPYGSSVTKTISVTVDDETGSGSGWNLDATSTTLSTGTYTLPTTATTITSASSVAATGNCSMPTNRITYPVTIPADSTPPTAAALFNAASGTGSGPVNITFGSKIAAPGNARVGSYSSTWTLTMASGP